MAGARRYFSASGQNITSPCVITGYAISVPERQINHHTPIYVIRGYYVLTNITASGSRVEQRTGKTRVDPSWNQGFGQIWRAARCVYCIWFKHTSGQSKESTSRSVGVNVNILSNPECRPEIYGIHVKFCTSQKNILNLLTSGKVLPTWPIEADNNSVSNKWTDTFMQLYLA